MDDSGFDELVLPEGLRPARLMAYGPIVNEYHPAAMYGPNRNPLRLGDVAASPDYGFDQGDVVDVGDGRLRTVNDWSYYQHGRPTSKTIELRDKPDQGHGYVQKVNFDEVVLPGQNQTPQFDEVQLPEAAQPQAAPPTATPRPTPETTPSPTPEPTTSPIVNPEYRGGGLFLPKSGTQFDVEEGRQVAESKLGQGIQQAVREAAPSDIGGLARMILESASPAVGGVENLYETGKKLYDISQGQPLEEAFPIGKTYPEFTEQDWGHLAGQLGLSAAQALALLGGLGAASEIKIPSRTEPSVADAIRAQAPAAPVAAPTVPGDLWYQGVSSEGATQWVTHDPKIAADYAKRRGPDAKVNVYTADQVGPTAFEDQQGNPISPQEYARTNWSTTLQTGGGPLPKPVRTLSISEAEGAGGLQASAPPAGALPATPEIGVAARYREEQQPGSVTPGTVQDAAYWRGQGRDYINKGGDPRMPIRAAQAGHVSPRNVGIVSAEYERLAANTQAASDAVAAGTPQAANALDAATKAQAAWSREMQPVFTRAGESLGAIQGRLPVDESTFAGLYDKALEMNGGRELPRPQQAELVRRTAKVARAKTAEKQTYAKLERVVPGRTPTEAQMQSIVDDMVKQLTPCK